VVGYFIMVSFNIVGSLLLFYAASPRRSQAPAAYTGKSFIAAGRMCKPEELVGISCCPIVRNKIANGEKKFCR
jgi:hypothetical protein